MREKFPDVLAQLAVTSEKRSSGLFSQFAEEFEDDLLEYNDFPESHLDFFLALLSDKRYYEKPGVWNFVLAVNNAKDALSGEQYERIANTFVTHYSDYSNRDLCLAVCDFVARNMSPFRAVEILRELKQQELTKNVSLQGYVDEGLFILGQEIKRADKE